MNRKHFKTQIYQLKNYHNEQVEVAFAGESNFKQGNCLFTWGNHDLSHYDDV